MLRYTALEPLRLAERLAFDRAIDRHELGSPPIFVLGHWRSGTTYLQSLLAHDPRFATTSLYDTLLADVSAVTRPWLRPLLNAISGTLGMPHDLQRMPLSFDLPGEVDVGLCCQLSPTAYTWGHLFPRRFEAWLQRAILKPDAEQTEAWKAAHDRYLRKLSWASGGRRLVLKSPGDTGRVRLLAEHYPQARFVFIHRDPVAVFQSTVYLWSVILGQFAVQRLSESEVEALILTTYRQVMGAYLDQREALSGRLIEVAYESLRDQPSEQLSQIYEALDLGPVPTELLDEAERQRANYAPHPHSPDPALVARLRDEWDFAFREWGGT